MLIFKSASDLARQRLLAARTSRGHWEGRLSSSALSTATAVVALGLFARARTPIESDVRFVARGIEWLLANQNADGGWGDTDRSRSNISTTALCWSALAFARANDRVLAAERRAVGWLTDAAGRCDPPALAAAIGARYGRDRTFSVPILTTCALAGRFGSGADAWRVVPQLPFELSVLPRRLFTIVRLPVVSYALPALIAMGLVRHRRRPSKNPLTRAIRNAVRRPALGVLASLQPPPGGFLEATPLTSFVALSLIGAGHADDPVTTRALGFIRASVREDGSWPIDTNLATWVTTLSVQALAAGGHLETYLDERGRKSVLEWLLQQQTPAQHPYTGAAAGAWAWTDLPGGVPDGDDTPGALLAQHHLDPDPDRSSRDAAARGVQWLLDLQNRDGGIPTFCRGWGALPFDRSGADLTAHALRAWMAWRPHLAPDVRARVDRAIDRAVGYLVRVQRADGAFVPLWFGNQLAPEDANPTYGTSRVLLAFSALPRDQRAAPVIARAVSWLLGTQHADGGWGGDRGVPSTVEETGLAVAALTSVAPDDDAAPPAQAAARRGGAWLAERIADPPTCAPSPIGLYFAKLWYYEELYPLIFATEALERLASVSSRPRV